jgi:hypothetical protein
MLPDMTLFLSFSDMNRLKVFENGVQRRMFGTKREGIKEGWRNLYRLMHFPFH